MYDKMWDLHNRNNSVRLKNRLACSNFCNLQLQDTTNIRAVADNYTDLYSGGGGRQGSSTMAGARGPRAYAPRRARTQLNGELKSLNYLGFQKAENKEKQQEMKEEEAEQIIYVHVQLKLNLASCAYPQYPERINTFSMLPLTRALRLARDA